MSTTLNLLFAATLCLAAASRAADLGVADDMPMLGEDLPGAPACAQGVDPQCRVSGTSGPWRRWAKSAYADGSAAPSCGGGAYCHADGTLAATNGGDIPCNPTPNCLTTTENGKCDLGDQGKQCQKGAPGDTLKFHVHDGSGSCTGSSRQLISYGFGSPPEAKSVYASCGVEEINSVDECVWSVVIPGSHDSGSETPPDTGVTKLETCSEQNACVSFSISDYSNSPSEVEVCMMLDYSRTGCSKTGMVDYSYVQDGDSEFQTDTKLLDCPMPVDDQCRVSGTTGPWRRWAKSAYDDNSQAPSCGGGAYCHADGTLAAANGGDVPCNPASEAVSTNDNGLCDLRDKGKQCQEGAPGDTLKFHVHDGSGSCTGSSRQLISYGFGSPPTAHSVYASCGVERIDSVDECVWSVVVPGNHDGGSETPPSTGVTKLETCPEQSACVSFSISDYSNSPSKVKVCMMLDYGRAGCSKTGMVDYSYVQDGDSEFQTDTKLLDCDLPVDPKCRVSGTTGPWRRWAKSAYDDNSQAPSCGGGAYCHADGTLAAENGGDIPCNPGSTAMSTRENGLCDLNDKGKQCQKGAPGDTLKFHVHDGTGFCTGSSRQLINYGFGSPPSPHSVYASCGVEEINSVDECVWSVVLPGAHDSGSETPPSTGVTKLETCPEQSACVSFSISDYSGSPSEIEVCMMLDYGRTGCDKTGAIDYSYVQGGNNHFQTNAQTVACNP